MSTKNKSHFNKGIPSEKDIQNSFEDAIKNNEVTDLMGNNIEEADLIEYNTEEKKDISFSQSLNILKGAQGKVLTIIDASIDDSRKRKYIKDLIKGAFSSQADWLFELTHNVSQCEKKIKEFDAFDKDEREEVL